MPAPSSTEDQRRPPRSDPGARPEPSTARPTGDAAPPAKPTRPAAAPPPVRAATPGRIALVIDDLGRSLEDLDRLDALGVPISWAVLPYEHSTDRVAQRLAGREVLVHLPMTSVGGNDPGPGALVETMGPEDLARVTREALDRLPQAVGVNNHMGSVITADPVAMRAILDVVRERHLFFVDSRTTASSVGYRMALDLGIPAAERQVFLDTEIEAEAIREQFARLLELSATRGAAIAIGHPHPATLEVLAEEVPKARAAGYEFVPVSYLLDRRGGE